MEERSKIETALKNALTGVHSAEILINTPTEWTDLMQPHRYKWRDGKLYAVSYTLGKLDPILAEVPAAEPKI